MKLTEPNKHNNSNAHYNNYCLTDLQTAPFKILQKPKQNLLLEHCKMDKKKKLYNFNQF